MLAVPIKEGFVMSRANYWWCMLLLFVLIAMIGMSIGASDARPYEVREMLTWVKVGGWIYLWSLGWRLDLPVEPWIHKASRLWSQAHMACHLRTHPDRYDLDWLPQRQGEGQCVY